MEFETWWLLGVPFFFALGWIAGLAACALGFTWLVTPMRAEGGLSLPFALALGRSGLFRHCTRRWRRYWR